MTLLDSPTLVLDVFIKRTIISWMLLKSLLYTCTVLTAREEEKLARRSEGKVQCRA